MLQDVRRAVACPPEELVRAREEETVPVREAVRRHHVFLTAALAILLPAAPAWTRGGGGCVEEGALISTPRGDIPVERLSRGDEVWTVIEGRLRPSTVQAVIETTARDCIELRAGGRRLRVTPEHPVAVGPGTFRSARALRKGDVLYVLDGDSLRPEGRASAAPGPSLGRAYNLLVSPGGVYFANGVALHNKGCFLPDTLILRPDGSRTRIQDLAPGDEVMAFHPDGGLVRSAVREVITHEADEYLAVATERVVLLVTPEHPFYVGNGTYKTVEALSPGDRVFAYDGAAVCPCPIVRIDRIHARARVYNLQTGEPNTFFAAGIAVHNKGGGGGSHSHGGSSGSGHSGFAARPGGSSSPAGSRGGGMIALSIIAVIAGVLLLALWGGTKGDENLEYVYGRGGVEGKAAKTRALLDFIARTDPSFERGKLEQRVRALFCKLQRCWEAREYEPMRPDMMRALYAQHIGQLREMVRSHEINRIEALIVEAVDLVNVRYTRDPSRREFTALITARARDYYLDDRDGSFLRGDNAPARFQEFWTFRAHDGAWLLREIEQTRESDVLKEENFFEPFTDKGLEGIYGARAGRAGPAGPWLEKGTETKALQTERLLNFLAGTDPLWDREKMLERARGIFMEVYLARARGDPAAAAGSLFPDVAASLREEVARRAARGTSVEYRNLCVRKAELILVRNYADNRRDEFTVRISAHAQAIVTSNGAVVSRQECVTPFVEYWTFGRLYDAWKLKEVLPETKGSGAVGAGNVDEDSSPEQLEWYYRKTRAE